MSCCFLPPRLPLVGCRQAVLAIALGFFTGCGGSSGDGSMQMATRVVAAAAHLEPLIEQLSLVGELAASERVEIRAEIDGLVSEIGFVEGQAVSSGDLLFKLDDSKLQASFAEAKANFTLAEAKLRRSELLQKNRTISVQDYDQARAEYETARATVERVREELSDASVKAPFQGVMGARLVSPGQYVTQGTPLGLVLVMNPLKLEFEVAERYLGRISHNMEVKLAVAAYPGEKFSGRVFFVSPEVNAATRGVLVKAEVVNSDGRLKPGMFSNIDLILQTKEQALLIPESALMFAGERVSVFAITAEKAAELREVQVGLRSAGKAEILSGVKPGEWVIAEGLQKVGPGAPLVFDPPQA